MSVIEFIGFVISFIAMIVLFFRRTLDRRRQAQDPALYAEMEKRREVRLKEFLSTLDVQHEPHRPNEDDEEEDDDEDEYVPPQARVAPKRPHSYTPIALNRPQQLPRDTFLLRPSTEKNRTQTSFEKHIQHSSIEDSYRNRFLDTPAETAAKNVDIHQDAYALKKTNQQNRVNAIVGRLESPQDLIILQEVIGPPKALRG